MNVLHVLANLALRVVTVVVISGATFLILLALHAFGVPLHTHPVIEVLGVGCIVTWRLYRGSTPIEEIRRFFDLSGPGAGVGLRSNHRWRGP